MNNNERVMIFIDGSNVFRSMGNYNIQNTETTRIDYIKLRDELCNGRNFIRAYYYGSEDTSKGDAQKGFQDKMRSHGFEVIIKPLKVIQTADGRKTPIEKGIDIALATDLISLAWEGAFDTAVIVSGDSDYVDAIKRVKQKGRKVEIASFRNSLASDMRTAGDRTVMLDDIMDRIRL
ncbi:MAG: NYN domain-containing protein [Candidatus Thermoplasmatota archaeon]|nr:NYN domain-containing protein [Candidatus Thermoplasmatota archaeon]MCL5790528.1 NYN domain-containing protein [Candidatus Thermoplasmatota archaeon]